MNDTPLPEGGDNEPNENLPQQVQMSGATARVPEAVGKGTFATGAIVMVGQYNCVIDFVQMFGSPGLVAARVVLPHPVLPQLVQALDQNLAMFTERYGKPAELPKTDKPNQRSIQELYDSLKLPDEEMSGSYAEAVMIRHSASEFCFDFITRFFPHAAVARRVFLSSTQVPPLLTSLRANLARLQGDGNSGFSPENPDEPPTIE